MDLPPLLLEMPQIGQMKVPDMEECGCGKQYFFLHAASCRLRQPGMDCNSRCRGIHRLSDHLSFSLFMNFPPNTVISRIFRSNSKDQCSI